MKKTSLAPNDMKDFLSSEDGAVTVDWVVLTATAVGLAIAAIGKISDGTAFVSNSVSTSMANMEISTDFAAASSGSSSGSTSGSSSGSGSGGNHHSDHD
ncbi:MAG: hypothetical protein KDE08_15965 [Rhodobacteraceae bacterium]|nr:hypothetical protein [Paracoccaceae bacterium]